MLQARGHPPCDRCRARRRDLRPDDDHGAAWRTARATTSRSRAWASWAAPRRSPRAGARPARPPRDRLRRGRLAPDAARLAGTIAGAQARNLTHLVFKNGVYHTSGAQGIPGGLTVDFVLMAKGAGYKNATPSASPRVQAAPARDADGGGPVLVELHTGLRGEDADDRPGRRAVPRQAEALRTKLLRPRG